MIFEEPIDTNYLFQVRKSLYSANIPEGKFLFNTYRYLQHQSQSSLISFNLWSTKQKQSVAVIHFALNDTIAVSPWRATFGGIEIMPGLSNEVLDAFIHKIHIYLIQHNIFRIKITNCPLAYDPISGQQITAALFRSGYSILTAEVNYHIPVTDESLENRLHTSEKRRLYKCQKAQMVWYEEKSPDLFEIYTFISQARRRKGFPMTLSAESFQEMFTRLPGIYRVFIVRHNDKIAALTVTVHINQNVLYNFYPADNEEYLNYSPTVFLTTELYKAAQREGYNMLDLGIATDKGLPNYGLMRFKSNIGGESSLRLSFQKDLVN